MISRLNVDFAQNLIDYLLNLPADLTLPITLFADGNKASLSDYVGDRIYYPEKLGLVYPQIVFKLNEKTNFKFMPIGNAKINFIIYGNDEELDQDVYLRIASIARILSDLFTRKEFKMAGCFVYNCYESSALDFDRDGITNFPIGTISVDFIYSKKLINE